MQVNNVNEAVGILVQAAEIGLKAGSFNMAETKIIINAIEFLNPNYFQMNESNESNESNKSNE